MMKQESRTRKTLMPARRAASALPPTAYTWMPHEVRESRKVSTTSSDDQDHDDHRDALERGERGVPAALGAEVRRAPRSGPRSGSRS